MSWRNNASWISYVYTSLIGSGKVSEAAIYDLDGGFLANSGNFYVRANEFQKIIEGFTNSDSLFMDGLYIDNIRYVTVSATECTISGRRDSTGCCLFKTAKTIVIAFHDDKIDHNECANLTQSFGEYLISLGF